MYSEQYRDTGFTDSLVKAKETADKLNIESELKTTFRAREERYSSVKKPTYQHNKPNKMLQLTLSLI